MVNGAAQGADAWSFIDSIPYTDVRAQVYSRQGYSKYVRAAAQIKTTNVAFGLSLSPTTHGGPYHERGDILFYWSSSGGFESCMTQYSTIYNVGGSYSTTALYEITYDGTTVTFLKNGAIIATYAYSSLAPLYFDSDFQNVDSKGISAVSFGPAAGSGAVGPQGPAGPAGPAGTDGSVGPQGVQGIAGSNGTNGADSTVPGPQGPQGNVGPAGPQGVQGLPGLDAVITLGTIPYSTNIAGEIAYDFNGSSYQTTTLEGPLYVSAQNISAGADTTIRLINTSAGTYVVTYNPSFQWLEVAPPSVVMPGKSLFISLVSFGANATDVFGNFARQV
jgi:hypothetical protein